MSSVSPERGGLALVRDVSRDKTQGPHGLREKKGPEGLTGPGPLSFGTTGKHGGGYPGDMPWDFMHPLVQTGRLSPRTERVKSLNKSMRGFLTELDNEYRHKQKQWGESKRTLECKLRDLRTLLDLSRFFVRKALRKLRERIRAEQAACCFHAWATHNEKRKSAQRAADAAMFCYNKSSGSCLRVAFLALKHYHIAHRYRARILHIPYLEEHHEDNVLPTWPQIQQYFLLWRCGLQVMKVMRTIEGEAVDEVDLDAEELPSIPPLPPDADSDEEEQHQVQVQKYQLAALSKKHHRGSLAQPRGANAVFLRRALMSGWRSLTKRRAARARFSRGRADVRQAVNIAALFSRWYVYRFESQAQNRKILEPVMKGEKALQRKVFSGWGRIVWTAKSEAYWKRELDERLEQFERQKVKYEQQVELLEAQLPRFLPDFGRNIPVREKNAPARGKGAGARRSPSKPA